MKTIVSKNVNEKWLRRRKRDKAKLINYWKNLYPDAYAREMVAKTQGNVKA